MPQVHWPAGLVQLEEGGARCPGLEEGKGTRGCIGCCSIVWVGEVLAGCKLPWYMFPWLPGGEVEFIWLPDKEGIAGEVWLPDQGEEAGEAWLPDQEE